MKALVNISNAIIPWIKEIADPTALITNTSTLDEWENGTKPTLAQVKNMSKILNVPFGYFFLTSPLDSRIEPPAFRTINSKLKKDMSPNLKETYTKMKTIQDWLKDNINIEDYNPSPISGIISKSDDISSAAQKIRDLLNLDISWYKSTKKPYTSLREKAGKAQVFIFESGIVGNNTKKKLDIKEFRAFALYDDTAPLIFINAQDSFAAKTFSLLHELAHIAIGENDLFNDGNDESFCNNVAAEIMVPKTKFEEYWKETNGINQHKIDKAVAIFKCSKSVIALRAFKLGFISQAECKSNLILVEPKSTKNSTGGDFYSTVAVRLDHNFLSLLFESVHSSNTRYTDAYRMTGCWGNVFTALMNKVLA